MLRYNLLGRAGKLEQSREVIDSYVCVCARRRHDSGSPPPPRIPNEQKDSLDVISIDKQVTSIIPSRCHGRLKDPQQKLLLLKRA